MDDSGCSLKRVFFFIISFYLETNKQTNKLFIVIKNRCTLAHVGEN